MIKAKGVADGDARAELLHRQFAREIVACSDIPGLPEGPTYPPVLRRYLPSDLVNTDVDSRD
jgi:hypothetical protein